MWSDFLKAYLAVVPVLTLQIMGSLIAVDFLLGVILAIKNREFTFQKLADYLKTDVVPVIVYMALGFPAIFIQGFATILLGIAGTLIAAETAMVLEKAGQLVGFPIPKLLAKPK